MANLTDADKVLRNDVGKSIVSKLDDIADAIVQHGGGAQSLGQLSDVDIDTTTLAEGQSIVYNQTTQKFENGEVSTVAALDDLTDVSITSAQKGDSLRNDGNGNWVNEPTTVTMTLAEWNAIADKQAWRNAHKNTHLVLTDAPNLNATAQDISYDGSTTTTKQKIDNNKIKSVLLTGSINSSYADASSIGYRNLVADIVNITTLSGYPTGKNILGFGIEYCCLQSNTGVLGILSISNNQIRVNSKTQDTFDFGIRVYYTES